MSKRKAIAPILFGVYCILMIWLLFGQRIGFLAEGSYIEKLVSRTNLIPFATITHQLSLIAEGSARTRHCVVNLVGNVIMFIPLGLLMPPIWKKLASFGRFILAVPIIILCVEVIQLFTLLGSMDIDDLILNVLGAAIGFVIYKAIRKIKKP